MSLFEPAEIAAKRKRVNEAYATFGFNSPEYNKEFDELHDMNMLYMAKRFRNERGLPPNAKTPYCPNETAATKLNSG